VEGVKPVAKFVTLAALLNCAAAQVKTERDISEQRVGRLCGQLLHVDRRIPGRGPGVARVHTSPLPRTTVKLYQRDSAPCCEDAQFVEQIETGSDGHFKFASVKPGQYWLKTVVGNREYKLPFQLQRPNQMSALCYNQQFELDDSGDFQFVQLVRID
jgi:hypothetical protein